MCQEVWKGVGDCAEGGHQIYSGDGAVFSQIFGMKMLQYLSDIMKQGYCFMNFLKNPRYLPGGCSIELASTIHIELLTYQRKPVNMSKQIKRYRPDEIGATLCPTKSVH